MASARKIIALPHLHTADYRLFIVVDVSRCFHVVFFRTLHLASFSTSKNECVTTSAFRCLGFHQRNRYKHECRAHSHIQNLTLFPPFFTLFPNALHACIVVGTCAFAFVLVCAVSFTCAVFCACACVPEYRHARHH